MLNNFIENNSNKGSRLKKNISLYLYMSIIRTTPYK